jgi:hypothetical protein
LHPLVFETQEVSRNLDFRSRRTSFRVALSEDSRSLREMYGLFLAAFRDAAELLKAGDRSAKFPAGSFPPGLPFVRALPP